MLLLEVNSRDIWVSCLNPVCVDAAEFDCRETSRFIHSHLSLSLSVFIRSLTHPASLTWQVLPIQMSLSQPVTGSKLLMKTPHTHIMAEGNLSVKMFTTWPKVCGLLNMCVEPAAGI